LQQYFKILQQMAFWRKIAPNKCAFRAKFRHSPQFPGKLRHSRQFPGKLRQISLKVFSVSKVMKT
jgi:hypothetical protein